MRWNLFNDLPGFKPRYNIGPDGDVLLTVVRSEAGNEGRLMSWPLIPSFAKTARLEYSTSNATAERLYQSPVYNRLLDARRCLIPINGFFEWQGVRPSKTPFYVYLKSGNLFALAGLWDTWRQPDGKLLESFSIITTEPNELMKTIHRRMPVILHRDDEEKWLRCSPNSFGKVQSILKPFPAELMEVREVSRRVNNPKYDMPDVSAPVES